MSLNPVDESWLQWTAYDAETMFHYLESTEGWTGAITLAEIRKIWNYGYHYFGPDREAVSVAIQNYFCVGFTLSFLSGARASSLGWPQEPLDDPGPA